MENKILWYGSSPNLGAWPSDNALCEGNEMTAISALYDPPNQRFVIAADGRCNALTTSGLMIVASDTQQKIFHTHAKHLTVMYALTGISKSADLSFDVMIEATKHIRSLSMRDFSSAYKFIEAFSAKMEKSIEGATKKGAFPPIPEQSESTEVGRVFRLYLLGFYRKKPFGTQARFYVDKETKKASTRRHDFNLSTFDLCCSGSERIAEMIYGNAVVDSRIGHYKHSSNASPLEAATSYIKACSDPRASEIDPDCKGIGGHLHAAESTHDGFRWLIPPVTSGTQS